MTTMPDMNAAEPEVPGLAARIMAADAFLQVLKSRSTIDDTLEAFLRAQPLPERDAALVRAIVTVAFRRYGGLKHMLDAMFEEGSVSSVRLEAILATAAAQILHMDVPDRAAVDLAVRSVRADRTIRGYSGLTNAVLRRVTRERDALNATDDARADIAPWLLERWTRTHGAECVQAIAEAHRAGATVDLTVRGDAAHWAEALDADQLANGSLRLRHKTPIRDLPGFMEGAWWIQDAAAALPVRLLAPKPGMRVADLCAAPGGKTAQLAAAGAEVLAVDRSAQRLKRLEENMARLGFTVETRAVDVLALDEPAFDAILLDAPCTATGTLRRHPEIAWTKGAADIAKLADLQRRLLDKAATLLKDNGVMIYCTCSLEPEEGEEQIAAFLERHPDFYRIPVRAEEIGVAGAITPEGDLRTLPSLEAAPGIIGMDGFFAARLGKTQKNNQ